MVRRWLKQLLLNTRTHEVSATDNPEADDALGFEDARFIAPRLGTPALCLLASNAERFHYDLVGVALRDSHMHSLEAGREERLEEDVCVALRSHDLTRAAQLLRSEHGTFYVVAVTLSDQRTGEDVEIGRMGSLVASSDDVMDSLVRPAFSELQLS